MTPEFAIHLFRQALLTAALLCAPLLLLAFVVGIVINLIQIVTSLQDSAFSTIPRLAAFLLGFLVLLPWMTMALVLRAIDAFRIFELALVLAGRVEPVLGTYIWSRYGPPVNDPYTAAAAAIVLFALIVAFIAAYLRVVAARDAAAT